MRELATGCETVGTGWPPSWRLQGMSVIEWVGLVVSVGLVVFLFYAMLYPDRL